jgi:hypothetical protein
VMNHEIFPPPCLQELAPSTLGNIHITLRLKEIEVVVWETDLGDHAGVERNKEVLEAELKMEVDPALEVTFLDRWFGQDTEPLLVSV